MTSMGDNPDLFISNGKPLQFNINGCQELVEIKQLIELFGGVIVNEQEDGVIQLVSPVKGEQYNNNPISYKYIYACVNENKLLPVEKFTVDLGDISSDSDNFTEEEFDDDDDDDDDNPSGFKREHDEAIVNFIIKNKLHKNILKNDTYNKMVEVPILSKINPQVLRQHFFDDILPIITDFDASDSDIEIFLNTHDPQSIVSNSNPLEDTQASINAKEKTLLEKLAIQQRENSELVTSSAISDPTISSQRKNFSDSQSNPLNSPAAKSLIEDMRLNLFNKATQQKLVAESSQAFDKMDSPISRQDCLQLINYISNLNCFQELKFDHTWRNIQKQQKLRKNTATTLRHTFENIILPNILTFVGDVNSKRLKPFLNYAGKECILPLDIVKYNICQVLNECCDSSCKYPHPRNKPTITAEFSKEEDMAILNFIVKKNCFNDLKLLEVWQEMSKQEELKGHSVLSLRTRFKILLDMLKNEDEKIKYLLEDEKCYLFRVCYDQITQDIQALEEAEKEKDFTRAEDYAIIGFIMEKRCIKDLDSTEMWREMQKHADLKHHTADALRKRFQKYLLPQMEVYSHCIPRKFFNAFVEYRFKKNNPRLLKIGDSDTLVKMCLPEKSAELEYNSKSPTGRVMPSRARRAKATPPAKTSTNRSESLKIFNLKKSLGAKLTAPPTFNTLSLAPSTSSGDSFDSQLLKDIVPGIKAMQDRFKRAAQESPSSKSSTTTFLGLSSQSSQSESVRETVKRISCNTSDASPSVSSKIQRISEDTSPKKQGSMYLTRQAVQLASSSTSGSKQKSSRNSLTESDDNGEMSNTPSPVKQKANKTATKENLGESKKRTLPKRGKLTLTKENLTTESAPELGSTTHHIEMIKKAKKEVFDVEEQISKWCCDSTGGVVSLRVDELKDVVKNLKNIEGILYKAATSAKIDMHIKSEAVSVTEEESYEIHKYISILKNTGSMDQITP